jgi:hypothetical protein
VAAAAAAAAALAAILGGLILIFLSRLIPHSTSASAVEFGTTAATAAGHLAEARSSTSAAAPRGDGGGESWGPFGGVPLARPGGVPLARHELGGGLKPTSAAAAAGRIAEASSSTSAAVGPCGAGREFRGPFGSVPPVRPGLGGGSMSFTVAVACAERGVFIDIIIMVRFFGGVPHQQTRQY